MSIESSLTRIADATEKNTVLLMKLVDHFTADKQDGAEPVEDGAEPVEDVNTVHKEPAPKAAPKKAPKAAPKAAPETVMTMEELNAAIVTEYTRIGEDMAAINVVLVEVCGEPTIANLDPTKYAELLTKIKELPTPAT